MPFHAERYPSDWKAISKRIRDRDGNACKTCKVPNGEFISRHLAAKAFMLQDGRVFHEDDGRLLGSARGSEWEGGRAIKVVLTVAHLGRPLQFPLFLHVARDADAPEVFKLICLLVASNPEGLEWLDVVHGRAAAHLGAGAEADLARFVVAFPSGAAGGSPGRSVIGDVPAPPVWVRLAGSNLLRKPAHATAVSAEAPTTSQVVPAGGILRAASLAGGNTVPSLGSADEDPETGARAGAFSLFGLRGRHLECREADGALVLAFAASGSAADPRKVAAETTHSEVALEALLRAGASPDLAAVDAESGSTLDAFVGWRGEARAWHRGIMYHVMDHDTENNADENLAALCQLHHLRHDAKQHAESARRTRRGRMAVGDLFGGQKQ